MNTRERGREQQKSISKHQKHKMCAGFKSERVREREKENFHIKNIILLSF